MLDLLTNYSIQDILIYSVFLAMAIKGIISFWDWGHERLRKVFKKETDKEQEIGSIQKQIEENNKQYEDLKNNQEILQETLSDLSDKVNLLVDSDKDDIKSFITREHHYFCYQKKWIDDYSLDCIERRYKHYKDEGGNSFIHELMEELRDLQKNPPQE